VAVDAAQADTPGMATTTAIAAEIQTVFFFIVNISFFVLLSCLHP
jgi:hypothetical protein